MDIVPLDDEPGYASVRARATKEEASAKAGAPESEKVVVFVCSLNSGYCPLIRHQR